MASHKLSREDIKTIAEEYEKYLQGNPKGSLRAFLENCGQPEYYGQLYRREAFKAVEHKVWKQYQKKRQIRDKAIEEKLEELGKSEGEMVAELIPSIYKVLKAGLDGDLPIQCDTSRDFLNMVNSWAKLKDIAPTDAEDEATPLGGFEIRPVNKGDLPDE